MSMVARIISLPCGAFSLILALVSSWISSPLSARAEPVAVAANNAAAQYLRLTAQGAAIDRPAALTDDPSLPRILLIGDSISMGYTIPVRAALNGKANVYRPSENCGPTTRGLEKLDEWLGKGHWEVIHFNFGLHDLKLVEGKHLVSPENYEKNLRVIVKRLQQTGATLIWCTTTPVPHGTSNPLRSNDDVLAYNAVAKKVMEENRISIDNLYEFALRRLKKIQRPSNVHYTASGYQVLAGHVAESIRVALEQRKTQPKH
jgi:hypothetical protein